MDITKLDLEFHPN
jgi:hypothetical protein